MARTIAQKRKDFKWKRNREVYNLYVGYLGPKIEVTNLISKTYKINKRRILQIVSDWKKMMEAK
jgi:hypothetical protein